MAVRPHQSRPGRTAGDSALDPGLCSSAGAGQKNRAELEATITIPTASINGLTGKRETT